MVQKNLAAATRGLDNAIEQLTTGYKLNHSKDNPANYCMMKGMETKLRAWERAGENISIGHNMLETAESFADLIGTHLIRIRDLCEQAANGTYGEASVKAIKSEVCARVDEIKRIRENAEFNDIKLFILAGIILSSSILQAKKAGISPNNALGLKYRLNFTLSPF